MSGKAILFIVAGIIMIAGIVFHRIEASSTHIVANSAGYLNRQSARNIAQSGVNLALRHLGDDSSWRTTGWSVPMMGGRATVTVFDTASFMGVTPVIGIRSTATFSDTVQMSSAFCYFPPAFTPSFIKGLLTLNAGNQMNGNIVLDARDHDTSGNIILTKGTYAIWTTGSSFGISGSAGVGGTSSGTDYAPPPTGVADPSVVQVNQLLPPPGYPTTPDSVFGWSGKGYPEGTLKAAARSGLAVSQYTTDPSKLHYPLSGVTYVEMNSSSPAWIPAGISGSGILIVHNSARTASLQNATGTFRGIIISDDIVRFHGNVYGAVIGLTSAPTGNVIGNGNAALYYSRQAILLATGVFTNGSLPKVIAWWE